MLYCRASRQYYPRRYIFHYYASCTDCYVIANGYARQYCSRAAYPYVVTDGNRACPFIACISFDRVGTMASSVYANVGTDKAVVANGDVSLIEHHKVEVGKESFSYTYVFAIITEERLVNVLSSLLPKIC